MSACCHIGDGGALDSESDGDKCCFWLMNMNVMDDDDA